MRVALVSRELAPFTRGGIGSYASLMARTLAGAGHEVHLLTEAHEGLADRPLFPGVALHPVDPRRGPAGLDAYPTYPQRYTMAVLHTLLDLAGRVEGGFDLVEFPDYHGEGYATIRAKRTGGAGPLESAVLAVRLHSPRWLCRLADDEARLSADDAIIEHLERSALREADLVIAPGRRVLERVTSGDDAQGIQHTARTAIVPSPIDAGTLLADLGDEPAPASAAGSLARGDETPTVLFFGKFQHLKGPQDLVAAATTLLDRGVRARFRLIGNDSPTGPFGRSMLETLRSRAARHADAITLEPALPRRELARAIRAAARSGGLCCFPSRWEAFPMVCLEAMALGAPVVASDAGGLAEIVEHERSGLLVPAGDAGALAAAIGRMLADADVRARLASAGPARVRALCDPVGALAALESAVDGARAACPPSMRPAAPGAAAARPPLVSIVIPYYNMGAYLPETLASARAQTHPNTEIIVVDDGSTDPASVALLDTLGAGVRIVRKPNGGLSSARNAGLAAARGEWVVPLDADDVLEPGAVARLLAAVERDPGLAFVSPLVAYFGDGASGGWCPLGLDRDLLVVRNVGAAASGTLLSRARALAAGGYDERLTSYEDWDFWCTLAERGERGTVVPEFLLRYRVRANSMFRTEALERDAALRAYLLRKHPGLARDAGRAMRMLLAAGAPQGSAGGGVSPEHAAAAARALVAEHLRYRLADRVNVVLKRVGVQRALKGLAQRLRVRG
ncbi:MAG: glycosyltransferase [Phycisphaerae bacterium]|nr:glycosyltransferase [Phycisphaerae bacterium]